MKKIKPLVFLIAILLPLLGIGQTLEVNKNDLAITRSDKAVNKTIHVSVKGIDPLKVGILTISDANLGTASRNMDYSIIGPLKRLISDTASIVISIKPDPDQKIDETIPLGFSVSMDGAEIPAVNETVTIKPFPGVKATAWAPVYAIDSARFTILTAGSLSFFGSPQFAKYVGQLDIRLPGLLGKKLQWGFNAGVFTKNYNVDSVTAYPQTGRFNVRIPNDTLHYAQKTYRRFANKVEYDVVGAYFNPSLRIAHNEDNSTASFRVYLDANLEFLATTIKSTYNMYNLIDSVSMPYNNMVSQGTALAPNSPRITPSNAVVTQHIITGYYGFGPQLVYQQNNLVNLNVVFLTGYSVTGIENDANIPNTFSSSANSHQFYYFAKGTITEKVTKLNATIGVEVRGFYPNNTGVAAYLGFLISPSDFFKK